MCSSDLGNTLGGFGYAISPSFRMIDANGLYVVAYVDQRNYSRLPLLDTNGSVSSVAPFEVQPDGQMSGHLLSGGFTQAPMIFQFEVEKALEAIDRVFLVVDGQVVDVKTKPPFAFSMIPDEVKDYTIYGLVRDKAGNLSASEETVFAVEEFIGGGIFASLEMFDGMEVESDESILLIARANSEFGVEEVEFYEIGRAHV